MAGGRVVTGGINASGGSVTPANRAADYPFMVLGRQSAPRARRLHAQAARRAAAQGAAARSALSK
jgi:hypothetical protein